MAAHCKSVAELMVAMAPETGITREQAAEALRLTASDLVEQGVADRIIPEPIGGAHRLPNEIFATLGKVLIEELDALAPLSDDALVAQRRSKFAKLGVWTQDV